MLRGKNKQGLEIDSLKFERDILSDAYFQLKKTTQKLEESEARYRLIVETTNEGILVIDKNQIITFINPRMVEILGFDKAEIIHKKINKFIYPEEYRNHKIEMDNRRNGKQGFYERRFIQNNGNFIWCHISATPVFDKNNKFNGSFAMVTDISDQKKKDQELHDSVEKFTAAFRAGPGLAAITRIKDGLILEINQNFSKFFGYKVEEVVGKTTTEVGIWAKSKDRKKFIDTLNKKGSVVNLKTEFRRSNGEIFPGLISSQTVKIAGESCILSVAIDITELKQTERALSQSEEKYRNIFDNTPDGVYLLEITPEKHFRTIAVNPALERLTGIPASFSVGKTQEETVPSEVAEVVNKKYQHCLESGKVIEEEAALDLPVGHRLFHSYLVPIKLSGRSFTHILGISSDVTDIRKMQERDKKIAELKNKFIQIVSHQLRTPLSAIRWNLGMIQQSVAGKIPKVEESLLHDTYQKNIYLIGQLNDILESMNIEDKKMRLMKEEADLLSIYKEVCGRMAEKSEVKNLKFSMFQPNEPLPIIYSDTTKIKTVMERLIDNAITYTPKGGEVAVSLKQKDNSINFEVKDTGIGIPDTEKTDIFEKFYRGSKAPQFAPNSFGLSLYLCKNYIEILGGHIAFTSEENKGTTFWFTLPTK